jgi:hypothetical protein
VGTTVLEIIMGLGQGMGIILVLVGAIIVALIKEGAHQLITLIHNPLKTIKLKGKEKK